MNKLSKKLAMRISIVIIIIFCVSFLLNNYFLSKYYLHEKKVTVDEICNEIKDIELNEYNIENIEKKYKVTVVYDDLNKDIESLNWSIKDKFYNKTITLNKFWITEKDLKTIKQNRKVNKLYNQGKLKSSFLVAFIKKENSIVAIGDSIVHDNDTIKVVNKFNLYLTIISLVLIIIVVCFFSKRIIYPLENLKDLSKDISNLNFRKINIKTNDEIEELGKSINIMSEKLKKSHDDLKNKNDSLKIFISNISHELKTPLALIKAYSMGLKDGLDDGSYIDTIINQTDDVSALIDSLLNLSRLEKDDINRSTFNIEELFTGILEKYNISIKNEDILISINKDKLYSKYTYADKEKIQIVLNNLISNAVKYTNDNKINIKLENIDNKILFIIKNGIRNYNKEDINKIWEPFYVIEESRNKKLSGTGLGLAIVKEILEKHNLEYGYRLYDNQIEFYIFFEKNPE
ncbi:sensor histidine kinase [Tepidibacter hydrothermalis]|uniref:histidine kinase n=1 Tax=Tepidibacter hydrothermalis TaxID=3036126 RepID=A0ABY8EH55_9FIRM|nr:HAMP domain-containing sensor histidine kinase [Tepidibacter hydrothermalis]WFD11185.1 HAMP domain-containing sensor histidine kinase [Tepidibacter hydrothermalis]